MRVSGIGDIRQVTTARIFFINDEGKEDSKAVNKSDLEEIYRVALDNRSFYDRMYEYLQGRYESLKEDYDKSVKYITDEDIEEEFKAHGRSSKYMELSLSQQSHNTECRYQWGLVAGVGKESSNVSAKKWEYDKLLRQTKAALDYLAGSHVEIVGDRKIYRKVS